MIRVTSERLDPDCGCYEAEMETDAGFASVHLKPCGVAEVFFDAGDFGEWECELQCDGKDSLFGVIQNYTDSLPIIG